MKIQKSILNSIRRIVPMKIAIHKPFYQNGHEYLTNSYYMIKMKDPEKHEDTPDTPIMAIAEKGAMPTSNEVTGLDIGYLMDILRVFKDNGAVFVGIKKSTSVIYLEGLDSSKEVKLSAILMGINI